MHTSHFIIEYSWNKSAFNFIIYPSSATRFDEIENPFYYCYIYFCVAGVEEEEKGMKIYFNIVHFDDLLLSMHCILLHRFQMDFQ